MFLPAMIASAARIAITANHPILSNWLKRATSLGRPMFIVFTFRHRDGKRLIQPLSARSMHKKEIEGYEAKGS
jgi:hypothetical protein